jgi:hypothetical protein
MQHGVIIAPLLLFGPTPRLARIVLAPKLPGATRCTVPDTGAGRGGSSTNSRGEDPHG